MEDLPVHLILEILTSGRVNATDLVSLELTSKAFRANHERSPLSLADSAAIRLCRSHPIFVSLGNGDQRGLLRRCNGNWKRVLRFLQSVEQSSDIARASTGDMQIKGGRYHTLMINDSRVYSCGSSIYGVLGHGPELKKCIKLTRIRFPSTVQVTQVSASHNHAAFVTQSGEVFTCGDNTSSCCGHRDTSHSIFKPKLVEELKGIPCKQVAAGLSFTMFLTVEGAIYTCGINTHGQLGHGDTTDRPVPEKVESLAAIVQIASGPSFSLAVAKNGAVFSFGSNSNFCLGHGEQRYEFQPREIESFKSKGIHVVRVSAGDEHVVALDSNGHVYTWGKGYCGALGHGDEIDKTTPEFLNCIQNYIAVQVCAVKRKTFLLIENGSVIAFGWMCFGSLGFHDKGVSEKVMVPQVLDRLRPHHVIQISTGLYHTAVLTNQGRVLGFGDNDRSQLGHDSLGSYLEPTEIFFDKEEYDTQL